MNLQESIRRILREETEPGKYTKAVQVIVDDFKNEDFVCDIDVSYYNEMYEIAVKIDKKEFEKKYESLHLDYANILMKGYLDRLKRTIRQEIKNFLPVDVLVWFKQINCDKSLNETEGKQERKFTKLLNNIQEYLNSNSYDSVVRFMVDYDEVMDDVIVNIFFDAEHAVKLGGGINSVIKRTGKKIMEDLSVFPFDFKYHIHFDRPQLNESKTSQHSKIINNLLEPFKEKDCLCDIKISFDVEENYYNIYLVFSQKELHEKFFNLYGIRTYIQKMMNEVKMELESFLPIRNVFIGYYTNPNCEWSPLNESEDDKEKKIQKNLKAIRTLLDTIDVDGLCEMWVEYNPEDGDYEIRSKTTRKYLDMADMVRELGYIDDTIRSWGMKTYVYTPWYVENCEDEIEFLNESENKKSGLLKAIEEDGLFQIMQDTSLSLPQIYTKTGELPREVLERYIKDFIDKTGYHQTNGTVQMGYAVEIQKNIQIEHFYLEGDKVTVEIRGYNDYNEQTDGYIENLSNLSDDEIFTIVEDMITWFTYYEM